MTIRPLSRRDFVSSALSAGAVSLGFSNLSRSAERESVKRYRVIFNCDGHAVPHSHNNSERHGPDMATLMKQLGDPKLLREKQKHLMFAADRGRPAREYPHNWMHCVLPAELSTDESLRTSIRVGEDLRKALATPKVTLRLRVENLQQDDSVEVVLNGKPVQGLKRTAANLLTAPLKPNQLAQGKNQVTLKLSRHSATSTKPRTVTALEIVVVLP